MSSAAPPKRAVLVGSVAVTITTAPHVAPFLEHFARALAAMPEKPAIEWADNLLRLVEAGQLAQKMLGQSGS